MACPTFTEITLPMLEVLAAHGETRLADLRPLVAQHMKVSATDLAELVASGKKRAFDDRANWACTYLAQAGLLDWVKRGTYRISDRGRQVLASKPARIDVAFLKREPAFLAWISGENGDGGDSETADNSVPISTATPEEQVVSGYAALRRSVEADLIKKILDASPAFFEQLVVELLVAMGYGGSRADAGKALGRSGDGGIDGIIKEDKLGLDAIYIQAKRWDPAKHKVSRPDVQAFAGSLEGVRARKGVFITTTTFSNEAHDYVRMIEKKIILIDGPRLGGLLFEHSVGVRVKDTYEVKEIDEDYFLDE
jgi:restriction system protein